MERLFLEACESGDFTYASNRLEQLLEHNDEEYGASIAELVNKLIFGGAIKCAALNGHMRIVDMLLSHQQVAIDDDTIYSLIETSYNRRHIDVVVAMLQNQRVRIDLRKFELLKRAGEDGHVNVIDTLLSKIGQLNTFELRTVFIRTIIAVAIRKDDLAMHTILKYNKLDVKRILNIVSNNYTIDAEQRIKGVDALLNYPIFFKCFANDVVSIASAHKEYPNLVAYLYYHGKFPFFMDHDIQLFRAWKELVIVFAKKMNMILIVDILLNAIEVSDLVYLLVYDKITFDDKNPKQTFYDQIHRRMMEFVERCI